MVQVGTKIRVNSAKTNLLPAPHPSPTLYLQKLFSPEPCHLTPEGAPALPISFLQKRFLPKTGSRAYRAYIDLAKTALMAPAII